MPTPSNATAIIEAHQRGQLDNVARTDVRWIVTTGAAGEITVEYNTDDGWQDFGTMDAKDVTLNDEPFNGSRWVALEWTNPESDGHYRLSITGPHTTDHDTYYRLLIQKRTHNDPDNEAYLTVQRVRSTDIPTISYPSITASDTTDGVSTHPTK